MRSNRSTRELKRRRGPGWAWRRVGWLAGWLLGPLAAAAMVPIAQVAENRFVGEPLPDPQIAGFHFPESEATITGWITEMSRELADDATSPAFVRIHQHGWGLWTAVTMETRQIYEGQRLRVFETWTTPDELTHTVDTRSAPRPVLRPRAALRPLEQFVGRPGVVDLHRIGVGENRGDRIAGFVKFDPTAAEHILKQELLSKPALDRLLEGGAQQIPVFPATALVVKPVFQILHANELIGGRYFFLKVWSGPPIAAQPWGPEKWSNGVWLDVRNGGRSMPDVRGLFGRNARTEATTYPLSSIINYRLSAADAAAFNESKPATGARAGDWAVLVAMHISTREIARWTWQTFWWTPWAANPPAPSSFAIASLRPRGLQGAARNYAMALGYTMLSPDQPYIGGENAGLAVYAYNPWIEAQFGPDELPDSVSGYDPEGRPAANNVGVQTNCMSCHARANYNPRGRTTAPRFSGSRYVDLTEADFVGTLQVDFLWSIARHAK